MVGAEPNNTATRKGDTQPGCCLNAGNAAGHAGIHHDDIGRKLHSQQDCSVSGCGLTNDLHAVPFQQLDHGISEEGVIVRDDDPEASQLE